MPTTLRRSVVTATASTGLLLTGAAAPALAQEAQQAQAEQPGGQNQPSQNQGGQLSKSELRLLVIDVVDRRVQVPGETQVAVKQLTDSVVTVDTTVATGANVQDERGLETELRDAIDQAIQERVDQGTDVQVNVDVQDADNGNQPDDGHGGRGDESGNGQPTDSDQVTAVPKGSVATGGQPDSNAIEYVLGGSALAAAIGAGTAATRRFCREDG